MGVKYAMGNMLPIAYFILYSYKWANSGIDESSPAAVKADVEGHNMAKTAGKEEMGKG